MKSGCKVEIYQFLATCSDVLVTSSDSLVTSSDAIEDPFEGPGT